MPRLEHIEAAARRKLKLTEDWKAYSFRMVGNDCAVVGDLGHEALVTAAQIASAERRYESTTGNCRECLGTGAVLARWSSADGSTYRGCQRCAGSGKAAKGRRRA